MIKFLNMFKNKDKNINIDEQLNIDKKVNIDKQVIIRTDGGICSQIAFCVLGLYLEDLGYKVKYDMSWFKECGKDLNNKFVRNYDMEKAFPDMKFEEASAEEIEYFRKLNCFSGCIPTGGESGYICGYPKERGKISDYKKLFAENFKPVDLQSCESRLKEIESCQSCAVHVRRGDLSVYVDAYGVPTPKEYYLKAVNIVHKLYPDVKFFFFSEEFDWIKNEIIPGLDSEIKYEICDENGADKGYLDLYLMMKSTHLIASSGSLARYAKILSDSKGVIVLDKYDKDVVEYCGNVILLNDTILLNVKKRFEDGKTTD